MYRGCYSTVKLLRAVALCIYCQILGLFAVIPRPFPCQLGITCVLYSFFLIACFLFTADIFEALTHYCLTTRESTLVCVHAWTWLCTSVLSIVVIRFVGQCKLNSSSYVRPRFFANVWHNSSPRSEVSLSVEIGSLLNVGGLITKRCYSGYGIVYKTPHNNT